MSTDKLLPCPNGKLVPLTKGLYARVSERDYAQVIRAKWYASQTKNKHYAARGQWINGKNKVIYMHREILGVEGEEVDHIDGDTLNNTRENLRVVKHYENMRNQKSQEGCSSKYKGVYLDKETGTWTVQIKDRGRMRAIHSLASEEIAGHIYDMLALDRFGKHARFNFPEAIAAWNRRSGVVLTVEDTRAAIAGLSIANDMGFIGDKLINTITAQLEQKREKDKHYCFQCIKHKKCQTEPDYSCDEFEANEKICETCKGQKYVDTSNEHGHAVKPCPSCNGTGREANNNG